MTQLLHPAAEKGFSSAAALYQQVRPDYPAQIVPWLTEQFKLNSQDKLLDLGTGTGKFLPYLQQISSHLIAVDPVAEMLEQLQQKYAQVHTIQALSHQLPLADHSIDAIFCAQSFHWFANLTTLNEIARVLVAEGQLGLIWNQRDTEIDWVQALAEAIAPFEQDTPRFHHSTWKHLFEQQTIFELKSEDVFTHQHYGKVEDVVSKRLLSTSFIAALSTDVQQQLKIQFEQIVFQYTGKHPDDEIAFPYKTYAYHFKKSQV